MFSVFFFNDTATTEIYTLSLHDALPISEPHAVLDAGRNAKPPLFDLRDPPATPAVLARDVDDPAPPAAGRARLGAHHLAQEALPDRPDGPGATARGAGVGLGAAHAVADPAVLYGLRLHLPVHPD